jgi:hypothetical protein
VRGISALLTSIMGLYVLMSNVIRSHAVPRVLEQQRERASEYLLNVLSRTRGIHATSYIPSVVSIFPLQLPVGVQLIAYCLLLNVRNDDYRAFYVHILLPIRSGSCLNIYIDTDFVCLFYYSLLSASVNAALWSVFSQLKVAGECGGRNHKRPRSPSPGLVRIIRAQSPNQHKRSPDRPLRLHHRNLDRIKRLCMTTSSRDQRTLECI